MSRIISGAARYGVDDFVLNLHHLPETISGRIGDGSDLGVRVRYSWEAPKVLGSAGGPRKALSLLGDRDFFILNGDTLCDVDLGALAAQHAETGAAVTMAVVKNDWPERYGGVVTDSNGIVYGFVPRSSPAAKYHFVGVQMAHPSVFRDLIENEPAESVGAVYRELVAARPGSIRAFLANAEFHDVGTPLDYLETVLAIARREKVRPDAGERSTIDPSATVVDSVLWDDVVVEAGAQLERCIVADGVCIPAGLAFSNCAIIQSEGGLVTATLKP